MVNIDGEYFCAARLHAPIGQIAGLPKGAITITLPRSHSKCMRFRGQRHGLVFRLLWSPFAPAPFSDDAPTSLIGWRQRLTSSIARGVSLTFGPGTCSRWVRPQVAVHKGDMPTGTTESTLLLTNREKPIIINSFHGGRGARICGLGFLFADESPARFLESKKIEALKKKSLFHV
jgi:hypothetical protein